MSTSDADPRTGVPAPTPTRDLGQFAVVALLVVVGVFTLVSTAGVTAGFSGADPIGPRTFPTFVGIGLLVLAAVLTVAILRGDQGEADGGEDVDLDQGTDWLTVGKLALIILGNIVLVDFLGFAITGALLFAGSAYVLGSRHIVRDVVIGAVLSVGSFYAFYVGLGVPIPPGILDGIL